MTLVALGFMAKLSGTPPPDNFDIPGAESQQAYDLFSKHSPKLAAVDSTVVFYAKDGNITRPDRVKAISKAVAEISQQPDVIDAKNPFSKPLSISPNQKVALSDVRWDLKPGDITEETLKRLQEAANRATSADIEVSMRGTVVDAGAEHDLPIGELIGITIAVFLLTLLFRSWAAMAATLLGALVGVAAGQLIFTILAVPLELPSFARTIAVMLGLGAGIDYALLIIGRFREQSASGDSVRDATAKSAATSGSAVLAAGVIVIVAIAGLLIIGIPMIGKMGIGAAIGVATVVFSALTFIPIMIGALSKRLKPKKAAHVNSSPLFKKWGEKIVSRPIIAVMSGSLILLVFAFPALDMRLGQPDDGNEQPSTSKRIAYDRISEGFGAGFNGPLLLAVKVPELNKENEAALAALTEKLNQADNVAGAAPPTFSKDKKLATIVLIPKTSPQDEATSELLKHLRKTVIPEVISGSGLKVYIGGPTATFDDFSSKVSDRLPVFISFVIGLSVLLLMAAFRSIWIPLVSAVFNLLSVAAAYGIITAVFQKGWGSGLIGVDAGVPIVSFIPVILFAILFGLSMDYNIFLLSRIHEKSKEGYSPRKSVVLGVSRIGKIILFAGLIMASVFLAFVTQTEMIAKMIGLGLGLAILIDVLLIRLLIAPAVVYLLGDKAWWFPKWLDKIVPNISLEGHEVQGDDTREEPLPGLEKE